MKRILWIALLVIMQNFVAESLNAAERRSFYTSIRCQAMGGACSAITSDETSLLINPSALGKLRDGYGTIIDPEMEFGYQTQGFYGDSAFSNPFSLEAIKDALDARREKYYHSKLQIFPSFVTKNFGIGLFGNYILNAEMNSAGTEINTYYRNDLALVLGFNLRFFDGRMKVGFNTKVINRIEIDDDDVDPAGSLAVKDIGTEGVGLSTDLGVTFTAPWTFLPTLSAVLRDVGGTSFDSGNGVRLDTVGRPNSIKQDLDVAMAIFPIHSNYVRSAWTVEYKGLLTASDEEDKAKLLHAGAELNIGDKIFLRAGYNQRYYTAGFEFASKNTQWQFTTYGEEIGTSSEHREDRRYAIKWSLRF